MGIDTKTYISKKYKLNDIKTVMERYLKVKVRVESCHETSIGMFVFHFKYKNNRMMHVHTNSEREGYYLLSLGYDEEVHGGSGETQSESQAHSEWSTSGQYNMAMGGGAPTQNGDHERKI